MTLRLLGPALLTLALLAAPAVGDAEPPKIPRLGVLWTGQSPHLIQAFLQGLRELGYIEGQNIRVEYRSMEGKFDRFRPLAEELVRSGVDVMLVSTTPGVHAAKEATGSIPIVMVSVGDPVGSGFVQSLARPGGNITGLATIAPDLDPKRLELIREIVPGASRVAVLQNPAIDWHARALSSIEAAARSLGLQVQAHEARGAGEFEGVFAAMAAQRADALVVLSAPNVFRHRARVADLAVTRRLPVIFEFREAAEAGALVSYGTNIAAQHRRAATYVDKILKGARPADLPVELPTKFDLVVNLKTAKALGLTIPHSVLLRADQVIQ